MAGKPLTPEQAEIERTALELRIAGYSYAEIAEKIGYANEGGAFKVVQRALKRTLKEPADALRQIEDRRLDAMLVGVWGGATTGIYDAVDRALKISKRRAELLGLDAPVRIAPTTPDGTQPVPITRIEIVRPPDDRDPAAADGDR